jgi:hypothetical protein
MKMSYSLISNPCERATGMLLAGAKKETLPNEKTEAGIDLHSIFLKGLEKWDFSEFEKTTGKNPVPLFLKWKWAKFSIEKMVNWTVPFNREGNPGREEWAGKVDLMFETENEITIIDCKRTGWTILKTYEKQLAYYAYSQLQKNPFKSVKTFVYFLEKNLLLPSKVYGTEDMQTLENMMTEDINRINHIREKTAEGKKLYTTTGNQCTWCNYAISCVDNVMPKTIEEATELLSTLIKCQAKENAIIKILKPYTDAFGDVSVDGKTAGWVESVKTTINEEPFNKFCQDKGIILKVSVTQAKKLAETYDKLLAFIFDEAAKPKFSIKEDK